MKINKLKNIILKLPKNARILDAGCGAGTISKYIKNLRRDIKFYAIDIDKTHGRKIPRFIKFRCASVEKIPTPKKYFDAILCFHVIEHLNHPNKAINEFNRVLKKNGELVIETPHWVSAITPIGYNFYDDKTHKKPFSRASLRSLVEQKFIIKEIRIDAPIYFFINKYKFGFNVLRNILNLLGIYKTVVWVNAVKR